MTRFELLTLRLAAGDDITAVRHVASRAATALGLDRQHANRIATSVSEIGRVATRQASTTVTFTVELAGGAVDPCLRVEFRFTGAAWRGELADGGSVGVAVRRLMEDVQTVTDGLTIGSTLPPIGDLQTLVDLRHDLLADAPGDLRTALQSQNTELVAAVSALRDREAELRRLNAELEQTNRGVVALYAELERRAADIRNAQRGVFEELERALRPLPPLVPELEFDIRYLPAQANSPTGGDLYDWVVLPDGTIHVAVVDVQGHGVASTRDALLVTHTVRTLVQEGHPLAGVLARADTLLQLPGRSVFATCLLARIDPASGLLQLAGAGHPAALLQAADGTVRFVEAPGRSLGYPGAGSSAVSEVRLAPGDGLLLYTDGLIEIRHDIIEGLATLSAVVGNAPDLLLPQLLDTVLAGCTRGDPLLDDTLLLGVRWHGPADGTGADQAVRLPSTVDAPGLARRYLGARVRHLPSPVVDDAMLLTSELVGNAYRHGGPPIRLTVATTDRGVRVTVRDDGNQIPYRSGELPNASQAHGRGLYLVATLARRWGVDQDEGDPARGKVVWFEL